MKKIGLIVKEESEKIIQDRLKETEGIFIVKYSGLSSPDMSLLRQVLRDNKARFLVVKNSLIRRVLTRNNLQDLLTYIDGPCGFVFTKDTLVETSKALYSFAKEHEQLKIEAGLVENRLIDKKEFESLAKLPAKEVLRAQVVMALNAPILKLALVLNNGLRKLVYCLEQIKNKKGSSN